MTNKLLPILPKKKKTDIQNKKAIFSDRRPRKLMEDVQSADEQATATAAKSSSKCVCKHCKKSEHTAATCLRDEQVYCHFFSFLFYYKNGLFMSFFLSFFLQYSP